MRRQDIGWKKIFQYVYLTKRTYPEKKTIKAHLQEGKWPSRKFNKLLEYWLYKIRYTNCQFVYLSYPGDGNVNCKSFCENCISLQKFNILIHIVLDPVILISGSEMKSLSRVRLFVTPWIVAYQAPPSMVFSRQEYWSGLPFPSPGDLPDPGTKPGSPTLEADALTSEPFTSKTDENINPFKDICLMSLCLFKSQLCLSITGLWKHTYFLLIIDPGLKFLTLFWKWSHFTANFGFV